MGASGERTMPSTLPWVSTTEMVTWARLFRGWRICARAWLITLKAFCSSEVTSAAVRGVVTSAASLPAAGAKRSLPEPSLRMKASGLLNSAEVAGRTPEASVP